jgi:hypothetical protein
MAEGALLELRCKFAALFDCGVSLQSLATVRVAAGHHEAYISSIEKDLVQLHLLATLPREFHFRHVIEDHINKLVEASELSQYQPHG